ncbi:MAG: SAM-dependent chlorinase/fluorinase [Kofleriaceae bacterium]
MAIITLTTDFGSRDGYVGAMKGVLARLGRQPLIVDIAHDIPRGDIPHAAWVVATACREFPEDTIHVVVVDHGAGSESRPLHFGPGAGSESRRLHAGPGVGGARRGVVIDANGSYYVGPDNGVFAYLEPQWARAIENIQIMAPEVSATFHGRDVFATAAAALALKIDPTAIGSRVELEGMLPWGERPAGEGRVVHIDHYGNLITDLPADEAGIAVAIAGRRLPIVATYESVLPNELLAYIGSARTVVIAIRDGRADRVLDAPRGTAIVPVTEGSAYR